MKYIPLPFLCLLFTVILSAPFLYAMPPVVEGVEEASINTGKGSNKFHNNEEARYSSDSGRVDNIEFYENKIDVIDATVTHPREGLEIGKSIQISKTPQREETSYEDPFQVRKVVGEIEETKTLDAITLLNEIAKNHTIIFPFKAPGLENYSPKDLLQDISTALIYKIQDCDERIKKISTELEAQQKSLHVKAPCLQYSSKEDISIILTYKFEDCRRRIDKMLTRSADKMQSTIDQNIIQYLQLEKEAFAKGAALLSEISQERENPKIIDFFDRDFVYLSKSFALYQDAVQATEERRLDKAQSLATQALGYLLFTQEKSQSSPREDILNDYKQAFALLEKSEEVLARGEDKDKAARLTLQAEVLLGQLQERLGDARENIIEDYQKSWNLIERAEKLLSWGKNYDALKAISLINQSKALYNATYEAAAREPREDIIQGYAESASFFAKALEAQEMGKPNLAQTFHADLLRNPERLVDTALDSHFDLPNQASRLPRHDQHKISGLAESLNGQGLVSLDLTREKSGRNRLAILDCYQFSFDCFAYAQKYVGTTNREIFLAQYYNDQGNTLWHITQENARSEGPRKNIIDGYWKDFEERKGTFLDFFQ